MNQNLKIHGMISGKILFHNQKKQNLKKLLINMRFMLMKKLLKLKLMKKYA